LEVFLEALFFTALARLLEVALAIVW